MNQLSEFLLARIAEDEALLESLGDDAVEPSAPCALFACSKEPGSIVLNRRRLLAECTARRIIIDRAGAIGGEPIDLGGSPQAAMFALGMLSALRYLALPYADHPDFRPEWAKLAE